MVDIGPRFHPTRGRIESKLLQESSFILEEKIVDIGIGPPKQESSLGDLPGWAGRWKDQRRSCSSKCSYQSLPLYPRCPSSTGPALLPVTMTSPTLLLPIKKGMVSKFYSDVCQAFSGLVGALERNRIGTLVTMKTSQPANTQ